MPETGRGTTSLSSRLFAVHPAWLAVRREAVAAAGGLAHTDITDTENRTVQEPTMNTTRRQAQPLVATALIALGALAAGLLMMSEPAATAAPSQPVLQLERVVIVGKRTPAAEEGAAERQLAAAPHVEQLPRVSLEGKRALPEAGLQLAAAGARCSAERAAC
jgi:hypothetical protein